MNKKLIGIKSSLSNSQLKNKIFEGLQLLELYLFEEDFKDFDNLKIKISKLIEIYPNLRLMLHCPKLELTNDYVCLVDNNILDLIGKMYNLCEQFLNVIGFIVHIDKLFKENDYLFAQDNLNFLRNNFENLDEYIYLENIYTPKKTLLEFLKENNIANVCFDIAHFTAIHNEYDLFETLFILKKRHNIYFHISDNFYNLSDFEPKNIGSGEIDFLSINQFIDFGIVETLSLDEDLGVEIKEDYLKLKQIFDDDILLNYY